ncbi:hypothetical protein AZ045_003816 [Enterobacter hormaechei]|nr:hypothetical protein AZ045_003816 [Enterobacter hormaechei]
MVYSLVNESQNGVEMDNELLKWLGSVITSSAVVGLATYLMRNTLSRIFSRSVEHHFEKKFESFKADLKDKEKELERISAFLLSARRDRDAALQSKRFEAAETIMRSRQLLSGLTLITEYLKYLNIDEIMKKGDDPKITGFLDTLMSPLNVDEQIKRLRLNDDGCCCSVSAGLISLSLMTINQPERASCKILQLPHRDCQRTMWHRQLKVTSSGDVQACSGTGHEQDRISI